MDVRRAASIWKIITSLHDIEMEDITNVLFDTISGVSNTRYFKSQKLVHEHGDEK